jgi:soluble lytic murein transglycosylase-like protein
VPPILGPAGANDMSEARAEEPTPHHSWRVLAPFVLIALAILTLSAPASAKQFATQLRKPSASQLDRLARYEPYIDYFTSIAYGPAGSSVSPDYIRALILTESAGEKFAVSNKGARGLTQIMPDTGRLAAQDIVASGLDFEYVDERRLASYSPDVLYDPAVNILIACYLGALYHADYSGRVDLVAAAWNAGPQAVARYGYRTPPYEETQGMVLRLVGFLNYFNATSPAGRRATIVPAVTARYTDLSNPRWNTEGWDQPGWDENKINWEAKF